MMRNLGGYVLIGCLLMVGACKPDGNRAVCYEYLALGEIQAEVVRQGKLFMIRARSLSSDAGMLDFKSFKCRTDEFIALPMDLNLGAVLFPGGSVDILVGDPGIWTAVDSSIPLEVDSEILSGQTWTVEYEAVDSGQLIKRSHVVFHGIPRAIEAGE